MSGISIPKRLYGALGDGARSNRYDVLITLKDPTKEIDGRVIGMLCKSASFPGRTHETIDFVYKGRSIPIRGQSGYEHEWSAQFYLDENHTLKNAFEVWIESLDEVHNYVSDSYARQQRSESNKGYVRDIKIYQQNFDDNESTAEYTLHNVFPKSVQAVDLNGADSGTLLEYQVTFSYSHYTLKVLDEANSTLVDKAMSALTSGLDALANSIMGQVNKALEEGANNILESLTGSTDGGDNSFEKIIQGATTFYYNPGGWMSEITSSLGISLEGIGDSIGSAISSIGSNNVDSI